MSDIAMVDGTITITYGLDGGGEPMWHVHIDGDIRHITALGLMAKATHQIDKMYTQEEEL